MKTRRFFYFGKFAVMGVVGIIAFTFLVMLLWNWLIPALFSGPVLTYWQTLGLLVLSKILFSGIGGGRSSHRSKYSHDARCDDREKWRKKYQEKMNGKVERENQGGDVIVAE